MYGWLRQSLSLTGDAESIEQQLAEIERFHNLTVLPFWAGERSTGWSTKRGGIMGLTLHTRPVEILRAAMEAVTYRFAALFEALAAFGPEAIIVASGNALRASPLWRQMVADVLGRPASLPATAEASTRGAALLALEAMGKIQSIERFDTPIDQIIFPDMSRHARYREGYERHQKLYREMLY